MTNDDDRDTEDLGSWLFTRRRDRKPSRGYTTKSTGRALRHDNTEEA